MKRKIQSTVAVAVATLISMPSVVYGARLNNPLAEDPVTLLTPAALVGRIVQAILAVSGTVALVMIIFGGVQIALGLKGGKDTKFSAGKKTISYAILGLIVSIGGFFVIDIVLGAIFNGLGISVE